MAARTKIAPQSVCASPSEARAMLQEMAEIDRQNDQADIDLNAKIDALKEAATRDKAPRLARRDALKAMLASFAVNRRQEFFSKAKSLDLDFGVIGFRLATKLEQRKKHTKAMIIGALKKYGLTEGISVKEDLNRSAMREWSDEQLALVGMQRVVSDDFFVDINRVETSDAAGA